MKIKKINFLFLFGWQVCVLITDAATNEVYVTEPNPVVVGAQPLNEWGTNHEYLPAKLFPEGNWGEPICGLQVSLRFDKAVYLKGEPITAIFLVRNITNRGVNFPNFNNGHNYVGGGGPIGIVAAGGQHLSARPLNPIGDGRITAQGAAASITDVSPRTQRRFLQRFDKMFELTNGVYLVHAVVNVRDYSSGDSTSSKTKWAEAKSADVQIKIETLTAEKGGESDLLSDQQESFRTVTDADKGQYAVVNAAKDTIILKNRDGSVFLMTNIVEAVKKIPDMHPGRITHILMTTNGLVVKEGHGYVRVDILTGNVQYLGND